MILVALAGAAFGALIAAYSMSRRAKQHDRARHAVMVERKEHDDRTARDLGLLLAAVDALDDGIIIVDNERVELVRNAAMTTTIASRRAHVLIDEAIEAMLRDALAGVPSSRELSLFGPPNQVLALHAAPLASGRAIGGVAWVRDITKPRHADEVRRDFVANVSHELRTPIGGLGLLAETMVEESDVDVMRDFAVRIVRESERLAHLVADLLDLSQLEADAPAEHTPTKIGAIVRAAVEQTAGAAHASSIAVRAERIDEGLVVMADRRQVLSAVVNLLDNAVKYSEPGGVVEVTVDRLDQQVAIMVRDRGIGIPARDLDRIFERFYRVDRARSRDTGGTGLGLSIVRHAAQSQGGDVSVISLEGEGSAFTLTLPLAEPSNPTDSEAC